MGEKTYKVAYNDCYGGFELSEKASEWLKNHNVEGDDLWEYEQGYCLRHDPILIQCIEELGDEASGKFSKIKIKTISSNKYRIFEYDGLEEVIQHHDEEAWITIE